MIIIDNKPLDADPLKNEYAADSIEREALDIMTSGNEKYEYDTLDILKFELRLRREIVRAANALYRSGMAFEVFRDTKCNPEFWIRQNDGGFRLKDGVKPSDAIRDIFKNSEKYGTECATAIQIIYYKALLEVYSKALFNRVFSDVYLMNWHKLSRELRGTGLMHREKDYLPGDRRYFANPDVDPKTPEWQGENVIDMGDGEYYGHGLGKYKPDAIIEALNENRREGAEKEAYLMDSAGRPNFKRLAELYAQADATAPADRQTA